MNMQKCGRELKGTREERVWEKGAHKTDEMVVDNRDHAGS